MDLCHITGSLHRRTENGLNKVSLETFPHTYQQIILLLTMLVDVCQCCCFLMFVCLPLSRHFPCCKAWWIKNLNSEFWIPQGLHWLPVQAGIDYKLSTICHSFFSDSCPAHFSDLTVHTPSGQLCSNADTQVLSIHHVRTKTFGERCFSCCAPKQWNWLPSDVRRIQSSHAFKTALNTHLYKQYHNKWFQSLSSSFCVGVMYCVLYIYYEVLCVHFFPVCNAWCAHPCQ